MGTEFEFLLARKENLFKGQGSKGSWTVVLICAGRRRVQTDC